MTNKKEPGNYPGSFYFVCRGLLERKIPSAVVAAITVVSSAIYAFLIPTVEPVLICSSSLPTIAPASSISIVPVGATIPCSLSALTQAFLITALVRELDALVTITVSAVVTTIVIVVITVIASVTSIVITIVAITVAVLCTDVGRTHKHEAEGHRKG